MTFIWQRPLAGYSQSSSAVSGLCRIVTIRPRLAFPAVWGGGFVIKMIAIIFVKYKHGRAPKACNMIRVNNQITCC